MTDTEAQNLRLAIRSVKDLMRVLAARVAELETLVEAQKSEPNEKENSK